MKHRIVLLAAGGALLAVVVFVTGWLGGQWLEGRRQTVLNTSLVVRQVQTLSEYVTVKYVLERVVVLEDAKWYGENRLLLLAHGVVKAGIDFSALQPDDVVIRERTITLNLPEPRITDAYLDEKKTQVIERTTGLLREFDKDLEQHARRGAVADLRTAARANGILKDARERAEFQLRTVLLHLGFEEVRFERPTATELPPPVLLPPAELAPAPPLKTP